MPTAGAGLNSGCSLWLVSVWAPGERGLKAQRGTGWVPHFQGTRWAETKQGSWVFGDSGGQAYRQAETWAAEGVCRLRVTCSRAGFQEGAVLDN